MFHVEQWTRCIAVMTLTDREIAARSLQAGRRAGLQADKCESKVAKTIGELVDGWTVVAAGFLAFFSYPDSSAQGSPRRHDNTRTEDVSMMFSLHAANLAGEGSRYVVYCLLVANRIAVCAAGRFGDKTDDGIFKDVNVRLVVDDELHPLGIFALGALRARGLYGGTAAGVERL